MTETWFSLSTGLLCAAAVAMLVLTFYCVRIPNFSGRSALCGIFLSAAVWSFGAAVFSLPISPAAKLVCVALTWFPVLAMPAFWLLFAWRYVRGVVRPAPLVWVTLHGVMTLVTVLLTLGNDRWHLTYLTVTPAGDWIYGPWHYVVTTYLYLVLLLGLVLVAEAMPRSRAIYRTHYGWIMVAMIQCWVVNLAQTAGLIALPNIDVTPFSFLVMAGILLVLLRHKRLFNLIPVARALLVDAIPDPMLVLDSAYDIVDANAAALELTGSAEPLLGRALASIDMLAPIMSSLLAGDAAPVEVVLGGARRHYDVTLVPVVQYGRQIGQMLLLRDVTRRAHLEVRLREQATKDTLTGLYNRRLLDQIGRKAVTEADASGIPVAVVMVDLDHFKQLNDTQGHHAGDQVLRTIGGFLRRKVRQTDFVFRTGGEEIMLMMPGANAAQALVRIDEWRETFAAMEIALGGGEIAHSTFSAGISVYPDDGVDLAAIMRNADQALYKAKAAGRNRAAVWTRDT